MGYHLRAKSGCASFTSLFMITIFIFCHAQCSIFQSLVYHTIAPVYEHGYFAV
ncbi:hypothetical protein JAAARDRAFT_33906, partial [Jaapia argillacea MUCL 33604]